MGRLLILAGIVALLGIAGPHARLAMAASDRVAIGPLVVADNGAPLSAGAPKLSSLGPLAPIVPLGQTGAWTARDEGGRLVLNNLGAAGAVRFYSTAWEGSPAPGRSVGVTIGANGTGSLSAAGLVFRIVPNGDTHWLAWVVTSDGKVAGYARKADGLKLVTISEIPGGHRPEGDLLQVNQKGDATQLFVNGHLVTELPPPDGDGAGLASPVGVVAIGTGTFTFGDFGFGPLVTPRPDAGPQVAGDDTVPVPAPAPPSPAPSGRGDTIDVPSLGRIGRGVKSGREGAWTISAEDGRLVYRNEDDDSAIKHRTLAWTGSAAEGRSVSVAVEARDSTDERGAGLVFGYDDKQEARFLVWIVTASKAALYRFRRDELDLVEAFDLAQARDPTGGHTLKLSQRGGASSLFVDGRLVKTVPAAGPSALDMSGDVGIVVLGKGRFAFRDFAFGPADAASPPTDDGGTPVPTPGTRTPPVVPTKPVGRLSTLTPETFGAVFGIMAHEFGHFMIGELKIPATGPEEDVADEFSAMVFIDNIRNDAATGVVPAIGNAKLWWFMAEDRGDKTTPWYDEHAPDRARFAKFMCMLYGADPDVFGPVMDQAGIPDRSKKRCVLDEPKRHAAWDKLLRAYRRRGIDPIEPGELDPNTPGHKITVVYEEPKDPAMRAMAEDIRNSALFDYVAEYISKVYVLPRDTKLVFSDCGMENCFYQPDDGSVTMCWEMIKLVLAEWRKHDGSSPTPQPQPQPQPPPAPQPVPQPTPQPTMTLAQYLVGRWHSIANSAAGVEDTLIDLNAQGYYRAQVQTQTMQGNIVINVEGQWSAAPGAGSTFQFVMTPRQWYPRQICQQTGFCVPVNLVPQARLIGIVDRNTLRLDTGMAKRVQ